MRRVIGVIGHVDHGKTALVRTLTGMDTDRLPEERRRGMSIALGFAHLTLAGATMDLIDMPGHERFVRTMVSGATGIDAVLIAVAANEGIKPQTVEHVDIAGLLGVPRAIIVATKADLAGSGQAERVMQDAARLARVAGLPIQAAVAVSAKTGEGIPELRGALSQLLLDGAIHRDDGIAYLPIDRAFTLPGHGTVVTGTLRRGALSVSDRMELAPNGPVVRLRALQVRGRAVARAEPGQRVAANLRDTALDQVRRGMALAPPGLLAPSSWLTVSLRVVAGAALTTGMRAALLVGTEETEARLRLLDRDEAEPGAALLAQLQCAGAVSVPARERFILRRISPPTTLAGGTIIDPEATRLRRHAPAIMARLLDLSNASPEHSVRQAVASAGQKGTSLAALARVGGVAPARAAAWLQSTPAIVKPGLVIARAAYEQVAADLRADLLAWEAAQPGGRSREQLAAALPHSSAAVLDYVVAELVRAGALQQLGGLVRIRRAERDAAHAADAARGLSMLAERLRQGGLSPSDPLIAAPAADTKRLLDRLVRDGVAIRAPDKAQKREILFHREAVEQARRRLAPLLAKPPGLLVSEAGAALGISRKFSVPLLEYLDAIKFTRRVADRRVLAQSS